MTDDPLPEIYVPKTPAWMVVFADLLSLLLTFFVLVFSMNSVQVEDWKAVVQTLSDRLNPNRVLMQQERYEGHEQNAVDLPLSESLEYLNTVIEEKLAGDPVLGQARVRLLDDRLAISIPSDLLFKTGSAEIADDDVYKAVSELAAMLSRLENRIAIIGYTDPSPVSGTQYTTHWELSIDRALAIARILAGSGYDQPIATFGYGGTRFGDLLKDLPVELQSRLSRRVDIVVRETEREQ
ncbi:MAG: chemotaxis protein MotB [Alphaproteobacteria bacterium]|nr:MAG: chemotaxis protein MotB [Alphaproteobacteria bacterium]